MSMKNKFNLLVKGVKGKEYLIEDFIATKLSEREFKEIQELNMDWFGDYRFVKYEDTDFSWWCRVNKKLTKTRYKKNCHFEIDFNGNVREI